jgi:uncharacterized iron-regulated membrane protein
MQQLQDEEATCSFSRSELDGMQIIMIVAQSALLWWKKRHKRSYEGVSRHGVSRAWVKQHCLGETALASCQGLCAPKRDLW